MKTNKNIRNLFFIFTSIFIIFCICFFNYKIDPYRLFVNKNYLQISDYPIEIIYTAMKMYRDKKYDTVVIGGSETISLFNEYYKFFFNNISMEGINFKQYKELLNSYLNFHPETKKVIIVLSYVNMINNHQLNLPELKEDYVTLKEYQRVLFSDDATLKSILSLKKHIFHIYIKYIVKKKLKNYIIEFSPKIIDTYNLSVDELKEIEKNNFIEIDNIINMLDEKKIDYIFIIPPYNSVYMSIIYNRKENQNNINNFRRFIVNKVSKDKKIYDFAFINKYTSSDISINKDALYLNLSHPSYIYGIKILKILLNDEEADNNIYFLLNKDNVESIIEKENKLIEDFINNNSKTIKYYKELAENQNKENVLFSKKLEFNSISNESKYEFEYMIRNIEKFEREPFIKYKRLSYLKYYI